MRLGDYPLKRVGSQGQQKSYLLAMKLGQAIFLGKPILLLDDIFDKLDAKRVERIIRLVSSEQFGQIFITDTDRQHLITMLDKMPNIATTFQVADGQFHTLYFPPVISPRTAESRDDRRYSTPQSSSV